MQRARHILLRWRNRDAASALDALRHHVGHRRAKRMAVGAWRSRRAHEVLRGWHEATRMQAAMEMWTGNTLKSKQRGKEIMRGLSIMYGL